MARIGAKAAALIWDGFMEFKGLELAVAHQPHIPRFYPDAELAG
jgi:hypothetical protein